MAASAMVSAGIPALGRGSLDHSGQLVHPLGNEIGAPVDPPTSVYTHSYAFVYQPVKHVGAMGAVNLPLP